MADVVSNIGLEDLDTLKGYIEEKTKSPYELKRLRNNEHLLILYTTGKLVVQGKNSPFPVDKKTSKRTDEQVPEILSSIGSDETLKGDTFGGIVIVGAYFSEDEIRVRDSKLYTDKQIIVLAEELLEKYPKRFVIKNLSPEKYNAMYAELGSQTAILNQLHAEVGNELKDVYSALHVVDQYPGCLCGDFSVTKAESHYGSVAAASVIARYYGIKQFEELSKKAGFRIPKGSTHVREVLEKMKANTMALDTFAKMHFSTVMKL